MDDTYLIQIVSDEKIMTIFIENKFEQVLFVDFGPRHFAFHLDLKLSSKFFHNYFQFKTKYEFNKTIIVHWMHISTILSQTARKKWRKNVIFYCNCSWSSCWHSYYVQKCIGVEKLKSFCAILWTLIVLRILHLI